MDCAYCTEPIPDMQGRDDVEAAAHAAGFCSEDCQKLAKEADERAFRDAEGDAALKNLGYLDSIQ